MIQVAGHKDVPLAVRTAGDLSAPCLLLVHGWSQHSLSWQLQLRNLAERFYLVAPDLRGHGTSGKPTDPSCYDNSDVWAGDVAAIIDQMNLRSPMLVGWSMGGWVVNDYVRACGTGDIAGISLVGSSITTGSFTPNGVAGKRDEAVLAKGMYSDDQAANVAATIAFLKACTAGPLQADLFAEMVGLNMLAPPAIRAACRFRSEDYRDTYRAIDVPVQVMWGTEERLAVKPYVDEMLDVIPGVETYTFEGLGHAPMLEDPVQFNAALTQFAERVFSQRRAA